MRVFAIKNEENQDGTELAYLQYFEKEKIFYIHVPEDADPWEVPLLIESFVKRGKFTVTPYWSRQWVRQRIVPQDRQNIGMILRDNGLKEYDEFALLLLGKGRCAQDRYYLSEIRTDRFFDLFAERHAKRAEDVIALDDHHLLVFFYDGITKKVDVGKILSGKREFAPVLKDRDIFQSVKILTGGYGVCWDMERVIMDYELYQSGTEISIARDDFISFAKRRLLNTAEASELLGCSRQYLNKLVKEGKLVPLKKMEKTMLFLEADVLKLMWK